MAAANDVKLLGLRESPYVNLIQFALKIKEVDYEFIIENLPHHKSELLLKSNPVHKKVPVLIHADKSICESLVIVEYIDEFWNDGPSILPSNPYDRSIARFWANYIDKWFDLVIELMKAKEEDSKPALREKIYEEGLVVLEDAFFKCSKGKAFFGGETIGYLDIVLGCFLGWLKIVDTLGELKIFDEKRIPGLVGWAERFLSHKITQNVIPTSQKLMEIFNLVHGREIFNFVQISTAASSI